MMNSGSQHPIRPSLGSWLTYGLGSEDQNLPGFVVLCPGKPVVGPALWGNSFFAGNLPGTHIKQFQDRSPARDRSFEQQASELERETTQGAGPAAGNERSSSDQSWAGSGSGSTHCFCRDGIPHAVRSSGSIRYRTRKRSDAHTVWARRICQRLSDRSPPSRTRVCAWVQLYFGAGQPWDAHGNIMDHKRDRGQQRSSHRRAAARLEIARNA